MRFPPAGRLSTTDSPLEEDRALRKLGSRTARLGVLAGVLVGALATTTNAAVAAPGTPGPGRAAPAPLLAGSAEAAPDRYIVVLSDKPDRHRPHRPPRPERPVGRRRRAGRWPC